MESSVGSTIPVPTVSWKRSSMTDWFYSGPPSGRSITYSHDAWRAFRMLRPKVEIVVEIMWGVGPRFLGSIPKPFFYL